MAELVLDASAEIGGGGVVSGGNGGRLLASSSEEVSSYALHSFILLLFYDALKSSHITFILFYYDKVEKVTVENVGTYVVGFWGGGELLVPSDHDETGGVAKVDVSNIMNQSLSFFFAYPRYYLQVYLTCTIDNTNTFQHIQETTINLSTGVSNLLSYKTTKKHGNEKQLQQVLASVVSSSYQCILFSFTVLFKCIQVLSGVVVQRHDDSGSSYLVSAAHE